MDPGKGSKWAQAFHCAKVFQSHEHEPWNPMNIISAWLEPVVSFARPCKPQWNSNAKMFQGHWSILCFTKNLLRIKIWHTLQHNPNPKPNKNPRPKKHWLKKLVSKNDGLDSLRPMVFEWLVGTNMNLSILWFAFQGAQRQKPWLYLRGALRTWLEPKRNCSKGMVKCFMVQTTQLGSNFCSATLASLQNLPDETKRWHAW